MEQPLAEYLLAILAKMDFICKSITIATRFQQQPRIVKQELTLDPLLIAKYATMLTIWIQATFASPSPMPIV